MMYTYSDQLLEALKAQVLCVAGIKNLAPADCKVLSVKIGQKTKQFLSETTLKRIYGFAVSQFQPSLFTKNILAQYCDYEGWKDFGQSQNKTPGKPDKVTNWEQLKQYTDKVTEFTLQALKHRSGIPYQYTIPRNFINQHMANFDDTGCVGTLISAPAGYGKTVALCHWIEEQASPDHIFLLLSSTTLMGLFFSNSDLNALLQSIMGCNPVVSLDSIYDIKNAGQKKFYLIIDGFDEHMFKKDQFKLILNQLVDVMAVYQKYSVFKLVLTIRPDTWTNYLLHLDEAKSHLYTAFTSTQNINVPLLSLPEIIKTSRSINPQDDINPPPETEKVLATPLLYQYFYKYTKDNFSLTRVDRTTVYELYSQYNLNKVYTGQHAAEKVILIRKLIAAMDITTHFYQVDKLKANTLIKEYAHAYHELITTGILSEFNESIVYDFRTFIRFNTTEIFTYHLAKSLLIDNNNILDIHLVNTINHKLRGSCIKIDVIKWCIIYAVKTGQSNAYAEIPGFELDVNKKSELILFIGELFKNELSAAPPNLSLVDYFRQKEGDKLFDYFFGMELINSNYKHLLTTLLMFDLPNNKKIIVYTLQALMAVMNLDIAGLNTCIIKLKMFNYSDHSVFAASPLLCMETLYSYLKFGEVKTDALKDLTRLTFRPPEDAYNKTNCAVNDVLYILGLYTLLFAGNPKKQLRMISTLNRFYKNVDEQLPLSPYRFFIQIALADCYFKSGQQQKVAEIYYAISNAYKKSENLLSPFMQMLFHCLKVKMLIKSPREEQIIHEMNCINIISKDSGSKFSMLYTLKLVLNDENTLINHLTYKKQLEYDYKKLVRSSALTDTFLSS